MLKLTRKLLLGIANTLHRYASSIEKHLARDNSSTNHSVSDYSDERPPAHWLAKVRQGAPQLLENHSEDDTQIATYSFEAKNTSSFNSPASNDSSEKPPAHWIEKVRRGAPHLLDEQPVYEENSSKHITAHEQALPQLPSSHKAIHEGNSVYDEVTVKQSSVAKTKPDTNLRLSNDKLPDRSSENTSFGSFDNPETNHLSTEIQHNPTQLKSSPSQAEQYGFRKMEKPFSDNKLSSIPEKEITKNKTGKTGFKQTNQSKSPGKYANTKPEVSSRNQQLSVAQLDAATTDTLTENKKYPRQSSAPHEQFTTTNQMRIKHNSHEKNKAARQLPNITIKPRNSAGINAFKQHGFNETTAPDSDHRASSSLPHKHKASKQLRLSQQFIDRHLSQATDNAVENISFESSQKKHPVSIPKAAEPFKSGLTHWPNLPDEKERRLPDDRWPELPEEKTPESDKIFQPVKNFAQLQKAIKRNHQSELEQRGIFWNG